MEFSIDLLLEEFSEDARERLKKAWDALPQPVQKEMESWTRHLPSDLFRWRLLMDLALPQFRIAFAEKHAIAIVGPANVGKSTLFNQLVHEKKNRADVSPVPGTTRINQEADAGLFRIIDTPGADAVGAVGEEEKAHALAATRAADFIIITFDAIQGVKRTEQELFDELIAIGKPYIVVLNKIDLVNRKEVDPVLDRTASNLRLQRKQIVPISAKSGENLDDLLISFATDTLKTRRSFCCEEHILAFKAAAVYDPDEVPGSQYKLRPYAGRPKKCRWRKEGWCEFEDVPCDNCKGDVKP